MGARFGALAGTRAAAVALLEEVAVRPEPCGMSLVCPGGACRELCAQVGCRTSCSSTPQVHTGPGSWAEYKNHKLASCVILPLTDLLLHPILIQLIHMSWISLLLCGLTHGSLPAGGSLWPPDEVEEAHWSSRAVKKMKQSPEAAGSKSEICPLWVSSPVSWPHPASPQTPRCHCLAEGYKASRCQHSGLLSCGFVVHTVSQGCPGDWNRLAELPFLFQCLWQTPWACSSILLLHYI